jgi:hypothetical protein
VLGGTEGGAGSDGGGCDGVVLGGGVLVRGGGGVFVVGGAADVDELAWRGGTCLREPGALSIVENVAASTAPSPTSGTSSRLDSIIVAAPALVDPTSNAARTGSAERFLTRRNVTVRQRTTNG